MMLNPGVYALEPDIGITTERTAYSDWVEIDGASSMTLQIRLVVSGGGTEMRCWCQTSFDGGLTACDVACAYFGRASAVAVFNVTGLTPQLSQITATNGALGDGQALDGVLGSLWRLRVNSVGTFMAGSVVSARIAAR